MNFLIACLFIFILPFSLDAESEHNLANIRQLTFPSMGFEKAGEAYFSPDEQLIIFQAVPNGKKHYQMYVMDINEKIPRLVSTGKGACTCGYFRPDGERILFASSHENVNTIETADASTGQYKWDLTRYMNIYEANVDGSCLRKLTSGPAYHAECSYSPDGTEILYASDEDGCMNLYIMDAEGENVRQITYDNNCYNGGPFFSPDGNHIAFRADRDIPHYLQLYVINKDGTNEIQLTANGAVNWAPYWHPNGSVLAFTTSIHGHHCYEIYLLNINTGEQYRLTNHPAFDGLPVFNRDGTKIMWTSKRGPDGTCQIFMADFTLPLNFN
jgi:Tol biopolymer transport system component